MPKRAKTNIYSTLARYGIGTSTKGYAISCSSYACVKISKSSRSGTPLAHIIQRTKTRSPFHEDVDTKFPNHLIKDYDPDSRIDFLTRLHTYKLMTYSSKPPEIDSVAASRCGWRNDGGKESLHCRTCAVSWAMPVNDNDSTFTRLVVEQSPKLSLDLRRTLDQNSGEGSGRATPGELPLETAAMRTYNCLLLICQGLISPYLSLDLFYAHIIPIDLIQGGVSTRGEDRGSLGRHGDQISAGACRSLVLMLWCRNEMKRPQTSVRLFYQPPPLPRPQCFALFSVPSWAVSLQVKR
jgi:hypothetical protein